MVVRSNIVGIDSPQALEKALRAAYYLADDGMSTAAYLALALGKPLLWLFGPQFVVGYDIMFVAAIGLVVRSAIGPVQQVEGGDLLLVLE